MKIYFAASIRAGRDDKDIYLEIIKHLQNYGQVLTEHIGDIEDVPTADQNMTDEYIFERDIGWIERSDLVIAEVTQPSLGVGYEIGFTVTKRPIFCLYREQEGKKLSAMLSGNKNLTIFKYKDIEDAKIILDNFFKTHNYATTH